MFPRDFKNEDNTYFWSGPKRYPKISDLNDDKYYSKKFILYFTKILLNALKVKYRQDLDLEQFFLGHNYLTSSNIKNLEENLIKLSKKIKTNSISPEIFEKDLDSNNHINFIHICSNLRARNYGIKECDKLKVKLIAGKIIPAISSTTSAITGFTSSQIYTLLQTNDINVVKDIRFNIATNTYFILNPLEVSRKTDIQGRKGLIIAVPKDYTCWNHIEIKGPKTIKEFFEYVKEKYKVDVKGMYAFEEKYLIKNKEMLEDKTENAYAIAKKKSLDELRKTLSFTIAGKNENNNEVTMPVFIYHY